MYMGSTYSNTERKVHISNNMLLYNLVASVTWRFPRHSVSSSGQAFQIEISILLSRIWWITHKGPNAAVLFTVFVEMCFNLTISLKDVG